MTQLEKSVEQLKQTTPKTHATCEPLVLTFREIRGGMLAQVGGKAANLGELTRADLPVPPGFCVTTAAYALAAHQAELEPLLELLATTRAGEHPQLEKYAAAIREKLLAISMPAEIEEEVTQTYQRFASSVPIPVDMAQTGQRFASSVPIPMAVRSSATAEDLPFASFAGQQDTYLNIVGVEAILDAVRRCWASLWTDRAVSYRASNGIDPRSVRLAVVIQQMVESEVAGVLFTANPLTGHRRQAVIDANPGLGEAVVSGAVNPDHFVVNTTSGEILERRLGDKRVVIRATVGGGTQRIELTDQSDKACISDEQVRALAQLGARVEAHYGSPQDTEWAIDPTGQLWLTQARPITTLYPLPDDAPTTDDELRVYLNASVVQGVYQPFTPMGFQNFRVISSAATAVVTGKTPKDIAVGIPFISNPGQRIFLEAGIALRNPLGRGIVIQILGGMEARSAAIFKQLLADPRLALKSTAKGPTLRKVLRIALRTRIPLHLIQALLRPNAARKKLAALEEYLRQPSALVPEASGADYLDAFERLIMQNIKHVATTVLPVAFAGIGSSVYAKKLLAKIATPDEIQAVLRSLPYNVTTEMDLSLWGLAQLIRTEPALADQVKQTPPEQLAQTYLASKLPPLLQHGLGEFLRSYGHRGVAEIDLGVVRWSEDPTHILGVLANYLQLDDPDLAPDVQFERGATEAEAMIKELKQRAKRQGWFYSKRVNFALTRIRELTGIREFPKFCFILIFAHGRKLLWSAGEELVKAGQVEQAEDIFFLTLPEAREALAGEDMRALIRERRATYDYEMKRRHLPHVLLSDGTEPTTETQITGLAEGALQGSPASAGIITGKARVIMDPVGARLEPGEILVAPSTDPGWTPLFLTAGGLVMEMGGSMSHGAVVAREYGIPAVVGVHGATERITTGQRITVDGSSGVIIIEGE